MSVLPKLLYLFQTVPVKLDKIFFTELNTIIRKFIWGGKKPRIAIRNLQDKRERGGFGLPKWETYHKAANIIWLKEWAILRNKRLLILEGHDLQKGWHAYLWEPGIKKRTHFHKHKIRDTLMQIWGEIRRKHYSKVPRWLSTMEAMIYPNVLELGKMVKYKDLLDGGGNLKTNEELKEQGIFIDWWPYAQIKSRYKKDKEEFGIETDINGFDRIWMGMDKKILAKIYTYLLDYDMAEEVVKAPMIAWAKNIGQTINLNEWDIIWNTNLKMTKAANYKENQYKMFYRWHLAPARIAVIHPNASPNCWKCGHQQGTYYHCWWSCNQIKIFWRRIWKWITEITGEDIDFEPKIFLLGILKTKYLKQKRYLITHILTAARISLAQFWKEKKLPSEAHVIRKILECAEMNRLTLEIDDRENTEYHSVWDLWYEWLEKRSKK